MRKSIIAAALVASVLSITACGPTENVDVAEENYDAAEETTVAETTEETTEATTEETTAETTTTEATTTVVTTEVTTTAETTVSAVTEVSGEDEKKDEAEKKDESASEFKAVEGFSDIYADLDNRAIAYNGTVFKLGESTFQDLVDAGVPFTEEDLLDADNNVNKGKGTDMYTLKVPNSKYSNLQFVFFNDTDGPLKQKECKLQSARWWAMIPRPTYDAERNEELKADLEEAAKLVSFAFPLTLTKDELIANSGTPTDDKYDIEYKREGKIYGARGYRFTFDSDSNVLQDVTIQWLP